MIEVQKSYRIIFSEEQAYQLFHKLDSMRTDLAGTELNLIYKELKDTLKIGIR